MSPSPAQALAVPVSTATPALPTDAASGEQDAVADFSTLLAGRIAGRADPVGENGVPTILIPGEEAATEIPSELAAADPQALLALLAAQISPQAITQGAPRAAAPEIEGMGGVPPRLDALPTTISGRSQDAAPQAAATAAAVSGTDPLAPLPVAGAAQNVRAAVLGEPVTAPAATPAEMIPLASSAQGKDLPPAVPAAGIVGPAEAVTDNPNAAEAPISSTDQTTPVGLTSPPARSASTEASSALRMEAAVTTPRWAEEMAQKVIWLANRNESRAELVLTPPQLGKVEVTLTVSQSGETSALFVSSNPQVREALEHSLGRLREVFAAAGMSLGQTSVSSDSPARDQRGDARGGLRKGTHPIAAAALSGSAAAPLHRGLVDTFV